MVANLERQGSSNPPTKQVYKRLRPPQNFLIADEKSGKRKKSIESVGMSEASGVRTAKKEAHQNAQQLLNVERGGSPNVEGFVLTLAEVLTGVDGRGKSTASVESTSKVLSGLYRGTGMTRRASGSSSLWNCAIELRRDIVRQSFLAAFTACSRDPGDDDAPARKAKEPKMGSSETKRAQSVAGHEATAQEQNG
ncbi:hypothetical protein K438DRAFT_1770536 [Mycena galopus ATCC 62051]|nr:hypothetical protein K438DRAFT_1770536 [Mycena galopus ATCC 62051]